MSMKLLEDKLFDQQKKMFTRWLVEVIRLVGLVYPHNYSECVISITGNISLAAS